MSKLIKGINDLATKKPDLAKEWHPTKNGDLKPTDVTPYSTEEVYWLLPYDDPETGIHHDFVWKARIAKRTRGSKCIYLSGQAVWPGFNDLATKNPDIAAEWNYELNGDLKPTDVTAGSKKEVYWLLPYDDPATGHHDFVWKARIQDRNNGDGCPYLSGKKVWPGYNDLETWCKINNRLDILEEWDYDKNKVKPNEVHPANGTKYWFICSNNHSYQQAIRNKTLLNQKCPECNKSNRLSFPEKAIAYYFKQYFSDTIENYTPNWLGKMELDIFVPSLNIAIEYDGERFHKNTKKDLRKNSLCKENNVTIIRVREPNCPPIDNCITHKLSSFNESELENTIITILKNLGITNPDIDIKTDRIKIEELIMQYNIKNSFETWCLNNNHPEYLEEWDYEKNGKIKPSNVSYGTKDKYWFKCKYGHSYKQALNKKTNGNQGCPYCSGRYPNEETNLDSWCKNNNRPDILNEWDYTRNEITPDQISYGSGKECFWICENNHSYREKVINKTTKNYKCPHCH